MATFTPLPFSEARALVAEFDLGELSRVVPIAAGSVNSNFKLEIEGKPELYFLRLYEEQGAAGVLYEAELLAHLAQNGVTTPRPVERRDGSPLSTVVGKSATIFPFSS